MTAVSTYHSALKDLAASEGASIEFIKSVILNLEYFFEQTKTSKSIPGLQYAAYRFNVELIDDRGKVYVANIPEWWRDGILEEPNEENLNGNS